jgi:hypothetical protein
MRSPSRGMLAVGLLAFVTTGCPTRTVYYDDGGQEGSAAGASGTSGRGGGGYAGTHAGGPGGGLAGAGGLTTGAGGVGGASGAGALGGGGFTGSGGTAGASGTAGAAASGGAGGTCQPNTKRCALDGLEACGSNGVWGAGSPCGGHQQCASDGLTAQCKCALDPTCSSIGPSCTQAGLLASCSQDGDGCFYPNAAQSCPNGACNGLPGLASCCTNACTTGTSQCMSTIAIQMGAALSGDMKAAT